MLNDFLDFIVFFSGSLSVLMALSQLIVLNRNINNFLLSFFYLCIGIMQIYHGFVLSGFLKNHPGFALIHIPFVYCIGPLLYIFFKFLFKDVIQLKLKDIMHLVPLMAILFMMVPFYSAAPEIKRGFIDVSPIFENMSIPGFHFPLIVFIVIISMVGYIIFFLKDNTFLWKKNNVKQKKILLFGRIVILSVCISLLFMILMILLINLFIPDNSIFPGMLRIFSILSSMGILFYFVMLVRYPNYYRHLKLEYQEYSSSSLALDGIDSDGILERINRLMGQDKLFCDDDLTMTRLARLLSIEPYQLSCLINEKLGKNFNTFINEYRIKEAKELLLTQSERSITSIAFTVGFNTISVFYKWFIKLEGCPPGELRNNINNNIKSG